MADTITIEVVIATPDVQRLVEVQVPAETTAEQAVVLSNILEGITGVDRDNLRLGVWGRRVDGKHRLSAGERLEIYRPLAVDPMEARRLRAARGSDRAAGRDGSR